MKTRLKIFTTVLSVLACFAFLPKMQAGTLPPETDGPPDGCYINFATAEGCMALDGNQPFTGLGSTAIGWRSLFFSGSAFWNTGVGAGTLAINTGDENTATGAGALLINLGANNNTANGAFALFQNQLSFNNTAVGAEALFFNDVSTLGTANNNTAVGWRAMTENVNAARNTAVGSLALLNNDFFGNNNATDNTAVGFGALNQNVEAFGNTAVGSRALANNDSTGTGTARFNTAVGGSALVNNTDGESNTAVGFNALENNQIGNVNTAVGDGALSQNTSGGNTAVGASTLGSNDTGFGNNAFGYQALILNVSGGGNCAYGNAALFNNVDGVGNNAFGGSALESNVSGGFNNAIGRSALFNSTGDSNTALGDDAGSNLIDGSQNIYVGAGVQAGATDELRFIRIGDTSFIDYDNFQAGIYLRGAGPAPLPVMCGSDGKLSANASSRRFKHDIKPIDKASEAILALKPVTYHYNNDATNTPDFGLIAEDVAEVAPDLVIRDKEGKPFSVHYQGVNAMLLNEFLKEHKKVEEQQASISELKSTVAQQQKRMEVLTAQFKEQAAQIQKVSAQLEVTKPAPQVVTNKP